MQNNSSYDIEKIQNTTIKNIFKSFNDNDINYMLWRPRLEFGEEIPKQMIEGDGDIDVIFLEEQRLQIYQLLWDNMFVADMASPNTINRDIIMFRGYDSEKNQHIMMHVHFKCMFEIDKRNMIQLPYENYFFKSHIYVFGIKCMSKGHFYLIEFFRYLYQNKQDNKKIQQLASNYQHLPNIDKQQIEEMLGPLIKMSVPSLMNDIVEEGPAILKKMYKKSTQNSIVKKIKIHRGKENFWRKIIRYTLFISRCKVYPTEVVILGFNTACLATISELIYSLDKVGTCRCVCHRRNTWFFRNLYDNASFPQKKLRLIPSYPKQLLYYAFGKTYILAGAFVVYDQILFEENFSNQHKGFLCRIINTVIYKIFSLQQGQLKYLLIGDKKIANKKSENNTFREFKSIKKDFLMKIALDYTFIDTAQLSPEKISSHIISDIFKKASEIQRNQNRGLL